MRVIETVREMREFRRSVRERIALVATLGGMHAGHEAHLVRAREIADVTIGSLFLNPTQFSPTEDLGTYPQNREHDLAMFERHGAIAVFAPPKEEMYLPGESITVNPGPLADVLEGKARPGHFDGVATVVAKLFNIIRPDVSTFGEKDAQQLRIIERLNRDLMFGIEIERIPTVRDPDGLALSSRNQYLTADERAVAPVIYQALESARSMWMGGERDPEPLRSCVSQLLEQQPLMTIDYVSAADSGTLEELHGIAPTDVLISVAVRLGRARLIDNVLLA